MMKQRSTPKDEEKNGIYMLPMTDADVQTPKKTDKKADDDNNGKSKTRSLVQKGHVLLDVVENFIATVVMVVMFIGFFIYMHRRGHKIVEKEAGPGYDKIPVEKLPDIITNVAHDAFGQFNNSTMDEMINVYNEEVDEHSKYVQDYVKKTTKNYTLQVAENLDYAAHGLKSYVEGPTDPPTPQPTPAPTNPPTPQPTAAPKTNPPTPQPTNPSWQQLVEADIKSLHENLKRSRAEYGMVPYDEFKAYVTKVKAESLEPWEKQVLEDLKDSNLREKAARVKEYKTSRKMYEDVPLDEFKIFVNASLRDMAEKAAANLEPWQKQVLEDLKVENLKWKAANNPKKFWSTRWEYKKVDMFVFLRFIKMAVEDPNKVAL